MSKTALAQAGFAPIRRSPRRLIANIQGFTKSGKARLALTAPKPLGYISVEIGGEEGVADQFIPEGFEICEDIQIVRVIMPEPVYPDRAAYGEGKNGEADYQDALTAAVQDAANAALDIFYPAYYASLKHNRTTVIDTGSDLYEIVRLSNFGRLEKVPQMAYAQVNKQMDKLLDDAFMNPGNVIFTHHMKDKGEVFTNDRGKEQWRASGNFDMSGYMGIKKKVQASIELWRTDREDESPETGLHVDFFAQIVDSRHSAASIGKQFTTLEIDFPTIATALFPGTKRSDWE